MIELLVFLNKLATFIVFSIFSGDSLVTCNESPGIM